MKQSFDVFMSTLKDTVANYKYYTDFDKVYKNVAKLKIELNILNSLLGSTNIEKEFVNIITEYPKTINAIPLLLAVRKTEIPVIDDKEFKINFKNNYQDANVYVKFMRETGLFDLMENKKIKCLLDYVTGVEVGLDSNARKNRTGTAMENIIENYIRQVPNVKYNKEMKKAEIKSAYGINLDSLILDNNAEKDAEKRFDFVIKTTNHLYLLETNFYSGGGSKLNETARSYKSLANDIKNLVNISFVWVTDGVGWNSAKSNLKETYDIMEHVYNLSDLEKNVFEYIFK